MILPPPDEIDLLINLIENYLDKDEDIMKRYRSLEKIREVWPGGIKYLFAEKLRHVKTVLCLLKSLK